MYALFNLKNSPTQLHLSKKISQLCWKGSGLCSQHSNWAVLKKQWLVHRMPWLRKSIKHTLTLDIDWSNRLIVLGGWLIHMIVWFEWLIGACDWLVQVIVCYTISISSLPVGHGTMSQPSWMWGLLVEAPMVGMVELLLRQHISRGTGLM